jgi:predicted ABC-type ATPase
VANADTPPVLHLVAGINGAGKTSFYYDHLASRTPGAEFVNADEIERERWPDAIGQHSHEAAELAAQRREALIEAGISFVTETVFSHRSKLELVGRAQQAGFTVVLHHIHVSTPELAIERVRTRVAAGGHDVEAATVIARHPRTLALLHDAVLRADRAYLFDNSRLDHGFTHVATFERGRVRKLGAYLPRWLKTTHRGALRAYLAERRGAT